MPKENKIFTEKYVFVFIWYRYIVQMFVVYTVNLNQVNIW